MEAPAVCRHILMNLVLLAAQAEDGRAVQEHGEVLPEVSPDRLQFFEYDSVCVSCGGGGGSNTWRVWRKLNTAGSPEACDASAPSCTIKSAKERHSGEYWCVTGEGGRSGSVNISVTAGRVILDIPARPVAEGSDLTLRCVERKTELDHISDFYKDGVHLKIGYENHMTIQNISKSDEGRYKCSISGKGESPESWLAVVRPQTGPDEGTRYLILLCVSLMVLMLLLLMGLILFRKYKALSNNNIPDETCTYAAVIKPRQVKEPEVPRVSVPVDLSEETIYSLIN